jgi:hypothetical protein
LKNFLSILPLFLLSISCNFGNMGELHTERSYVLKGTEKKNSVLPGYDSLSFSFEEDSNLIVNLFFIMDSMETIEELNFQLEEVDSTGKVIRSFSRTHTHYISLSTSGEGGTDEHDLSFTGKILFKNIPDSVLNKMKVPHNEQLLTFSYANTDSMPSFLHVTLDAKTNREGKRKTYHHEADFEKLYIQYRGSGGSGKIFCMRQPADVPKERLNFPLQ